NITGNFQKCQVERPDITGRWAKMKNQKFRGVKKKLLMIDEVYLCSIISFRDVGSFDPTLRSIDIEI
ncbi:MAG: hypothetical protein J7604_11900, partial [Sporocytophaga sp.]|uniref:hypothetical protein n=1 Tax=Sporocytophaga sp. TaxID=2231183 RepID=UPI001B17D94E